MAATAPVYNRIDTLKLYALSSAGDTGVAGYWAGYYAQGDLGSQASLAQVWADAGGVYLFCRRTPDSFAAFQATLQHLLPRLSPTGWLRALWIDDPNAPGSDWQLQRIDAAAQGSGADIVWKVARQALFLLGGYALSVRPGSVLALLASGTPGYGIGFADGAVTFASPGGTWPAVAGSAWMPLAGSALGALCATLALDRSGAGGAADDLAGLGVMLRYATPLPDSPTGEVLALPMPVLTQNGHALQLALRYDPLNPLLAARSRLGFYDGVSNPVALGSHFVTTLGYATTLTPQAASGPLSAAALAFCRTPLFVTAATDQAYYDYYLAPDGHFQLTVLTPDSVVTRSLQASAGTVADRLMLGLNGLEYAALPTVSGTRVFFRTGQAAFVPAPPPDPTKAPDVSEALNDLGSTAHLAVLPAAPAATGLSYYAQPRQAPLFAGAGLGADFLAFHEMRAAYLPGYAASGQTPPPVLPVGAYAGLDRTMIPWARRLEASALAPVRRYAIGLPVVPTLRRAVDASGTLAVTPQGLVSVLSDDGDRWAGVVLANMPRSVHREVALTAVGPALQAALQSNQLFFVVSDVTTFMDSSSVAYQLTPESMPLLRAAGVPESVITALNTYLRGLNPPYPAFDTEKQFVDAITPIAGDSVPLILPVAGLLKTDIDGWTFQLSPRSWRSDAASPTLMIFKYCNRSLEDLAADTGAWGWPQAAGGTAEKLAATQAVLRGVINGAKAAPAGSAYRRFYDEVAKPDEWNGVLFLNAPVAIAELPDDLQFLAAGIDSRTFYAHHVGFSLTPFTAANGQVVLAQTAAFGLIDYQDPVDLYAQSTVPFGFKTLSLTARFANAALADFSAQVELLTNRLFGAELTKVDASRGNNLVLAGSYQRVNGAPSYSFLLVGQNRFAMMRSALNFIDVQGVALQTQRSADALGNLGVSFVLSGDLLFQEFVPFDVFSYGIAPQTGETPPFEGRLRFGNLAVAMRFNLGTPDTQEFSVAENRIHFDLANSQARPDSLAMHFPLTLSGFIAVTDGSVRDASPEDQGYVSVVAPIDQLPMTPPWYGLVYTLDLGTLGALAGSVGLAVKVLAAWSPGAYDNQMPVYVGVQLPSAKTLGLNLPLQGVLRLAFRSFQFATYQDDDDQRGYLLRLRRFALSVLGLSFPPGNADVTLFGDPSAHGASKLGWYAAYTPGSDKKKTARTSAPTAAARRLRSGRRRLPPGR